MANIFRLKANTMFERSEEELKESPLRIVFLSVEGNKTERQYFGLVEKYRDKLGIKASVHIHPLQRAKHDNLSAPEDVLELLEEYLEVRNTSLLPKQLKDAIPNDYSDEFIADYLKGKINQNDDNFKRIDVSNGSSINGNTI